VSNKKADYRLQFTSEINITVVHIAFSSFLFFHICVTAKKAKFSHTCYRALCLEPSFDKYQVILLGNRGI